jgi:hypothetical protein
MRKFQLILAALLVGATLVPAQAQAFKPDIIYVRATDDNEGIRFSVKVRMDKGGRNQRRVSVTYDGEEKNAEALERPPLSVYETGAFSAPSRNCYQVTVRAHNRFGTTTKTMRAATIGTNGCG